MCAIKIVIAFCVLLTVAYARPDGYGVKGVNPFRATANAAASAHAFGNTGPGSSAIAQSSASAYAGGTANAAAEATANAFADGENIGKAISSATAIANANHHPIGRSDVLDRPSHREKDTEYKAGNHQDGTPACDQHIPNAGHGGLVNNENSTPGNIGSTNTATTLCHPGDSKCRNSKNDHSLSSPYPGYNGNSDLSSGSSGPLPDRDGPHGAGSPPCAYGNLKCAGSKPYTSNPDQSQYEHSHLLLDKKRLEQSSANPNPSHMEFPDSSASSLQPLPNSDDGFGDNPANPGSRPCTPGSPKCSGQPNVPYPNQRYPYSGWVGNPPIPGSRPCTPGSKKCSGDQPFVSYPSDNEHPDLPAGSTQPSPNSDGSLGDNPANPGSNSCTPGSTKCSGQPNVPYANQQYPYSGWAGNPPIPGSNPCTSGSRKCSSQPNVHVELSTDSGNPVTKPSVWNQYPSYNKRPDLSAGSSQPLPNSNGGLTGNPGSNPCSPGSPQCSTQPNVPHSNQQYPYSGWAGNPPIPGSSPCTSGSPKCSGQPNGPHPNQPHDKRVESTTDSTSPTSPCTSGSPKCSGQPNGPHPNQPHDKSVDLTTDSGKPVTKPSISNPYPSYNKNPSVSAGSSQPLPSPNGGWAGNPVNPGSQPCTPGSPKCSGQPNGPHPNQPHDKSVELGTDSGKPVNKPSVSNPYPSYNKNPSLSAGSSQTLPNPNGGWAGNPVNPGSNPCTPGTPQCSGQPNGPHPNQPHDKNVELTTDSEKPVTKPSTSNPYPSYNKNPSLSAGSSQPLPSPNGGWAGNPVNPGSNPCTPGSPKCSMHPNVPYPNQQYPYSGWAGNPPIPGPNPCTSGSSKCSQPPNVPHDKHVALTTASASPVTQPSVANPYPSYNKHPDLSVGSSQPLPNPDGGYGGPKSDKPTGEKEEVQKTHQQTPFNKNPDVSPGSSYPSPNFGSGCSTPGSRPCTSGSAGSKPGTSNPFLNGEIDVSEIRKAVKSDGSGSESSGTKSNPLNPFLNPHGRHPSMTTDGIHSSGNPNYNDKAGPFTHYPESKPNPSNPFFNGQDQHLPTPGKTHHSENPNHSDQGETWDENSEGKPNPLNPFLNGQGKHLPTLGKTHHPENPNNRDQGGPSNVNSQGKPNPLNPFLNGQSQHLPTPGKTHDSKNPNNRDEGGPLDQYPGSKPSNPHNQHPSASTVGTHHLGNQNGNDKADPSNQYPGRNPSNPSNPVLNPHNQHPSPSTVGTHHLGNQNGNDKADPSNQYPGRKPSNPSNPVLNPHNQHPSASTVGTHHLGNQNGNDEAGPSNEYPYNHQSPSIPNHRDEVAACSRGSCNHQSPNTGNDDENSDADGKTPGRPSDGAKTYRPGVKGSSARRPQSSSANKYHDSGDEDETSADADASWDAYSKAHAVASASAGGNGNAHANSQAHSSANSSGWSNSWASSSASASASASSSSWH